MKSLQRILIAGGGSSGWMTAALLARMFQGLYEVVLVESEDIGTIGVGEATIPAIKKYNELLGLDENEFMQRTQASFKLGIRFENWLRQGDSYIHGFGVIGQDWEWLRMHHYWLHAHQQGQAGDFADYSINTAAALKDKFVRAQANMGDSPLSHIAHAFHMDAALFARFLSGYAQDRGVRRREGRIVDVSLRAEDGFIESVTMHDGEVIAADLFIDCSGFRGLFINQALGVGFEDWSHWLPCDRAIAVPCARSEAFTPYTRSIAHSAGWQWRIPLQHRTGNGHVYCSRYISDDEATAVLMRNLDGEPLAEPRTIRYITGRRDRFWDRNCVAVGLASGFLEPLESTSIHLIQTAITRIIRYFPNRGFDAADVAEYNQQTTFEYERIRDFLISHYHVTRRSDSPFWNYCRTMEIPATLQHKLDLFAANGRFERDGAELFAEQSWIQVLIGQGLQPRGYHPIADTRSTDDIDEFLGNVEGVIEKCVKVMPSQAEYIAAHCAAPRA